MPTPTRAVIEYWSRFKVKKPHVTPAKLAIPTQAVASLEPSHPVPVASFATVSAAAVPVEPPLTEVAPQSHVASAPATSAAPLGTPVVANPENRTHLAPTPAHHEGVLAPESASSFSPLVEVQTVPTQPHTTNAASVGAVCAATTSNASASASQVNMEVPQACANPVPMEVDSVEVVHGLAPMAIPGGLATNRPITPTPHTMFFHHRLDAKPTDASEPIVPASSEAQAPVAQSSCVEMDTGETQVKATQNTRFFPK